MARLGLAVLASVLVPVAAFADVKPHPLFTDHMVLQAGRECPVWGLAAPDEKVSVSVTGSKEVIGGTATADKEGKWSVKLPKQAAGVGYTLIIEGKNKIELKNVAYGEVWICSGQSNMEWKVDQAYDVEKAKTAAKNPMIRLMTVAKRTSTKPLNDQGDLGHFSTWAECSPENVGKFSAVGFNFGKDIQKALNVPVGLIHTSWGGTPAQAWASLEALQAVEELKYYAEGYKKAAEQFEKDKKAVQPGTPSSLYNAMIHPLLPFAIKGAIWYQGESNAGRAVEYRTLFPTMISDWRAKWGYDFPFYAVQLAPFIAGDSDGVNYAELRDAQLFTTKKLKNVGMAVITDVGDLFDIHPREKAVVGGRLAKAALAGAYEKKTVGSGPTYKEVKFDGAKAVVSFENLGQGLAGRAGPNNYNVNAPISGFTICGEDDYFYPAKAKIEGDTVVVTSDKVAKPKAVRFGWSNYPVVNLFNKDGLPASPFRTDDLPLTTATKK